MDIRQYLDSTYLKTAQQAGISEAANDAIVKKMVEEAIAEQFKLVMVRPNYVLTAKQMVSVADSRLQVGTVIDFPNGTASTADKLAKAQKAIADGADELDFVINYEAFAAGNTALVKDEVLACSQFVLSHLKTIKWIIETAALSGQHIVQLSALIKNVIISNFEDTQFSSVFVKSSTGFFTTADGRPNGATIEDITLMLENASPLPVKASGGVRDYAEAVAMINLGVKRIGTSSAKAIVNGQQSDSKY